MNNLQRLTGLMARAFLLAGLTLVGMSCDDQDDAEPTNLIKGPTVTLSNNKVLGWSWVMVNQSGTPLSIGIELPAATIMNLGNTPVHENFELPAGATMLPFNHIDLHWNPAGHPPANIYGAPHFDTHFYTISRQSKEAIPGEAPFNSNNQPVYNAAPPAKYLPADYEQDPGVVPAMGAHWIDKLADEFKQGGIFTKTFIYGSHAGKVIFIEPMYTKAYLEKKLNESTPIRQPQARQQDGYYPTSYTISYNPATDNYRVSLDGLKFFKGE